jgi:hypothetical protein
VKEIITARRKRRASICNGIKYKTIQAEVTEGHPRKFIAWAWGVNKVFRRAIVFPSE